MAIPDTAYEDAQFNQLRETMKLSSRGRTAGLLADLDGNQFILGWDSQAVACVLAEPSDADGANVTNAMHSGTPLRIVGNTNLEVSSFNKLEPLTNNPDLPGRPAADVLNIRVETVDGDRVIPVPELDFLRAIHVAAAAPFIEHHTNGSTGNHQVMGDARNMYSLTFPEPHSDHTSVVLPLPISVPGTRAVSNEREFKGIILSGLKQLILNDLSSQSDIRPTYYAMSLLSERGVPAVAQRTLLSRLKQLEGVTKGKTVRRLLDFFASQSDDLQRLSQYAPDIIRAQFEPTINEVMDGLDLNALVRINANMLQTAEQVFHPGAPVETRPFEYDTRVYTQAHPFLIHKETDERVLSPGFVLDNDSAPTFAPGVTGDLYRPRLKPGWVCVVEIRNNGGVVVPEYHVVPARGWKTNRVRGTDELRLEVAEGFYLGSDHIPYLLPGYIWNPQTREAELFV